MVRVRLDGLNTVEYLNHGSRDIWTVRLRGRQTTLKCMQKLEKLFALLCTEQICFSMSTATACLLLHPFRAKLEGSSEFFKFLFELLRSDCTGIQRPRHVVCRVVEAGVVSNLAGRRPWHPSTANSTPGSQGRLCSQRRTAHCIYIASQRSRPRSIPACRFDESGAQ